MSYKNGFIHQHTFFHCANDAIEFHPEMVVVQDDERLNSLFIDGEHVYSFHPNEYESVVCYFGNKLSNEYAQPGAYAIH